MPELALGGAVRPPPEDTDPVASRFAAAPDLFMKGPPKFALAAPPIRTPDIPPPEFTGPAIANPLPANAPPPVGGDKFEQPGVRGAPPPPSDPGAALAERVRQGYITQAGGLTKVANEAISRLGKMDADLSESMKRVREALDKTEQSQEAALKASQQPPQQPVQDAMQKMGGLATVVGILGGLLTKAPMRASINAGAAAIEAYNRNDLQTYQIAYGNWKTQTDMLFKLAAMQADHARDILANEKLGMDERRTQLDIFLRAAGLGQLADAARTNGDKVVLDWYEKNEAAQRQYQLHKDQIDATAAYREAQLGKGWGVVSGTDPEGQPIQYRYNPNTAQATDLQGNPLPFTPTGATKVTSAGGGQPLTPEAIDFAARRAIAGDHTAVQGLGYGTVGANNRTAINNRMAELGKQMGLTPEQVAVRQNEFRGQSAMFQSLGRRTAGIEVAVQELTNTIPALLVASQNVDRTQVPAINAALLAAERGTGDEKVIQFGLALNAVMKAYAQAMNPTGIARVADFERAENLLSTAWSKGQIKGAVDQMNIEIEAAQKAPGDVWDRIVREAGDRARGPEFMRPPTVPITGSQTYKSSDDVLRALDAGKITKDQAKKLMIDNFGFREQ